jgi:hypothetical protein
LPRSWRSRHQLQPYQRGGNVDKSFEAKIKEPSDEISLETLDSDELCEKLFVIPRHKVDSHYIGIKYDAKEKLYKKGIKVRKKTWRSSFPSWLPSLFLLLHKVQTF